MTTTADRRKEVRFCAWSAAAMMACVGLCMSGCRGRSTNPVLATYQPPALRALEIKYATKRPDFEMIDVAAPRTDRSEVPTVTWDLSLDEAIRLALSNTEILRSLGATVIPNPQAAASAMDRAIQSSDPLFGIQAALSQFDAQVTSNLLYTKNDDVFNNPVLGGGATEVRDDVAKGTWGMRKTGALGTQFSAQNNVQHSNSTNPSLLFPHSWTMAWEGTVRQPLMQGRGALFNSIAGPTTQPGFQFSNGVALSRVNHEISIAQFDRKVCTMVREITESYWQLSLAHQRLEATKRVRDLGWATWQAAKARYDQGLPGGGADAEALARSQYLQFQSQVLNEVSGSSGGPTGILQAEANLRRLLGLPQSDDRFLRPIDEPSKAPYTYDWPYLASLATNTRSEVREQMMRIKQREMQLIASRNFLLPRLDAIGTLRANGFGDDLIGGGSGRFSSALKDLASNDHGEAEFGIAYDYPVGLRRAHAAVRNAELLLRRENAVLEEQNEQILFEVGNALRALYRSQADLDLQLQRMEAAQAAVDARQAAFQADTITMDQLLESQQRLLDAQRGYFDALLAIQQAHTRLSFESGQLLGDYAINVSDD